jgi:hypothetical protein
LFGAISARAGKDETMKKKVVVFLREGEPMLEFITPFFCTTDNISEQFLYLDISTYIFYRNNFSCSSAMFTTKY